MKRKLLIAIFLLISLIAGCAKFAGDPLIGKWKEIGKSDVLEVLPDGSFIQTNGLMSITGRWQRLDDGRLKLEAIVLGITSAKLFTVKIDGDKAVFTESNGETTNAERLKT